MVERKNSASRILLQARGARAKGVGCFPRARSIAAEMPEAVDGVAEDACSGSKAFLNFHAQSTKHSNCEVLPAMLRELARRHASPTIAIGAAQDPYRLGCSPRGNRPAKRAFQKIHASGR